MTSKHSAMRSKLHKALNGLNRRNPTGYAQLLTLPFGIIPAYAEDDHGSDWWISQEAKDRLRMIRETE